MKSILYLMSTLFLLNCYTYNYINTNEGNKIYDPSKIYVLTIDGTRHTVKNLKKTDGNYSYLEQDEQKTTPEKEISSINEKKFSWGKTIGLAAGVFGALVVVTAWTALDRATK